jgi:hypothetical protein
MPVTIIYRAVDSGRSHMKGRKRANEKKQVWDYCPEFRKPSIEEAEEGRGAYPWTLDQSLLKKRERLMGLWAENVEHCAPEDVNNPRFFTNQRSGSERWWDELPLPINSAAWLVNYVEEGQTFPEYVDKYLGEYRFRQGTTIYLLPIVASDSQNEIGRCSWSAHAPSLSALAQWVSAFYDRECEVMPAAFVRPNPSDESAFTFDHPTYKLTQKLRGRQSEIVEEEAFNGVAGQDSPRYQIRVQDLLRVLENIKTRCPDSAVREKEIAIVGVTMVDLFSHASDLFVAGFAGRGVSMLSLRRYHPRMVMSDSHWDDYAFYANQRADNKTYLTNDDSGDDEANKAKRRKKSTKQKSECVNDLLLSPPQLTRDERAEYFRRAGRLINHELGHNYGLEHCIHHHCFMNGSGNLEEDFVTPALECGICLRKLQFRLGFGVVRRYEALLRVYQANGMNQEASWTRRRLDGLTAGNQSSHIERQIGLKLVSQREVIELLDD